MTTDLWNKLKKDLTIATILYTEVLIRGTTGTHQISFVENKNESLGWVQNSHLDLLASGAHRVSGVQHLKRTGALEAKFWHWLRSGWARLDSVQLNNFSLNVLKAGRLKLSHDLKQPNRMFRYQHRVIWGWQYFLVGLGHARSSKNKAVKLDQAFGAAVKRLVFFNA